jgi:hypothetical protein
MAEATSRPLRYWRAVASLPVDRVAALAELEACFAAGGPVERLDGATKGRLITTTFGYGLDRVFMGMASLWMPWKGKVLDPEAKEGRNIFASPSRVPLRMMWPGYRDQQPFDGGRFTTFRFTTWTGEGKLDPEVEVFKIDYDLPDSPGFLIRDILDELVQVDDGLYLGQALLRWRGRYRRAAWFQLEA